MRFYSYRDPHLDETLQRFRQAGEWLSNFEPTQEELEGFVVATTAGIDAPVKPREIVRKQASDLIADRTPEQRRETRRQVIATELESLRNFAKTVDDLVASQAICVFGNKEILESSKAGFKVVNLVG